MGNSTGDGMLTKVKEHASAAVAPSIISFVGLVIALPPLLQGASSLGVDLIPWASKGALTKLEARVDQLQDRIEYLETDLWQRRLRAANAQLQINPLNEDAAERKLEAERMLRRLARLRGTQ